MLLRHVAAPLTRAFEQYDRCENIVWWGDVLFMLVARADSDDDVGARIACKAPCFCANRD